MAEHRHPAARGGGRRRAIRPNPAPRHQLSTHRVSLHRPGGRAVHKPGWAILPTTLKATFTALEATGELSWQKAATVEEAFDKLQAAANILSHADRELEVGDLAFYPVVLPAAPDFTDFITPRMLGCARGGALVNLRLYLQLLGAGSNMPDERTQPGSLFSDSKTSLVASASAWLKRADAAPSMRQKAADVAMFLGFSHPQHDKFLLHVPADDIFSELTRRGRSAWPAYRRRAT